MKPYTYWAVKHSNGWKVYHVFHWDSHVKNHEHFALESEERIDAKQEMEIKLHVGWAA